MENLMLSNRDARKLPVVGVLFLIAMMWLLPFCIPIHSYPVGTFWQEWTAVFLLSAAIIGMLLQFPVPGTLHIPKIVLAPVGLALVIGLQLLVRRYNFPAQLNVPLIYLSLAVLACCLGKAIAERNLLEDVGLWVAVACLMGGLFSVGVQLAQLLGIEERYSFMSRQTGHGLYANINQVNQLAAYLAMSLAAALYCRLKHQLGAIAYWTSSALLLLGLVLTGQRSAAILVLMPFACTFLAWGTLPEQRRTLLWSYSIQVVLFISFYFLVKPLISGTHLYLSVGHVSEDPRWDVWVHALMMFKSHLWLGVGFSQFGGVYFDQLDTVGGVLFHSHPHNLFAALLAETGIVGTLLTVIPVAAWGWRTRLRPLSIVQWFGWTQLLIIGAYSMIEFPLWYAYWLIIAAFWFGAMDPEHWKVTLKVPRIIAAIFMLIVSIALMDLAFTNQKLGFTAFGQGPKDDAGQALFQQYRAETVIAVSRHWFFEREGSYQLAANMLEISPDNAADKIVFNEKVMKAAPSPIVLSHQVVLYVLIGDVSNAVRWLARARMIYPAEYSAIVDDIVAYSVKWPQQFSPAVVKQLLMAPQ